MPTRSSKEKMFDSPIGGSMRSRFSLSQKGFTLVEVIVVAVIVAALAAVAIGVYLNYVKDARKSAVKNSVSSLAAFCGACVNSQNTLTLPTLPATGGVVKCAVGSADSSSINIPSDVKVTSISSSSASGIVVAEHAKVSTVKDSCKY